MADVLIVRQHTIYIIGRPSPIEKSIQSRGRPQDVMRIFIGRPLDLPMSALIQKASFGRPMDIPWIWISCGYLMDNPQDVQWIENAIWVDI